MHIARLQFILFTLLLVCCSIMATTFASTHNNTNEQAQTSLLLDVPTIIKRVENSGYNNISEIRLEYDAYYVVSAFTKAGIHVKLLVDGKTGKVPTPLNTKHISMLEAAQKVEAAGYHQITFIKLKQDHFDVRAKNSQNILVKLWIDPKTGIVSQR